MSNSALFDIKIKEAFEILASKQLTELPSDEELKAVPEPSAKYKRNMNKLLKKCKSRGIRIS